MQITRTDFENIMSSLLQNEVDKTVISDALSQYCNRSVDAIKDFVSFKVLRAITGTEDKIKGFVNFEDVTASIDLEYTDKKYVMKSLNEVY